MANHSPSERWREIDDLFDEALGRDPADWDTFLAERCGDDTGLHREVLALLRADEAAGQFPRVYGRVDHGSRAGRGPGLEGS